MSFSSNFNTGVEDYKGALRGLPCRFSTKTVNAKHNANVMQVCLLIGGRLETYFQVLG